MPDEIIGTFEFKVWGRYALFTDPISKVGGEKTSYHLPTYEAIKGITKSIYWKPTIIWHIEKVRIVKPIRTETKGTKLLRYYDASTPDLAYYTFLSDVEYQVKVSFSWNMCQRDLCDDRNANKHRAMIKRSLERGGRQDIFLGVRNCQGYVEPCQFGSGVGHYDNEEEVGYSLYFHSFDYPDETGEPFIKSRFWRPTMQYGIVTFPHPKDCSLVRNLMPAQGKKWSNILEGSSATVLAVEQELSQF